MRLADGPSDVVMGTSEQKDCRSPSPFGTLKDFGSHLSKVIAGIIGFLETLSTAIDSLECRQFSYYDMCPALSD